MSIINKSFGNFKVVKDPIALDARYAVVSYENGIDNKPMLICEMTQIRGDSYEDNAKHLKDYAEFICKCFDIQSRYDISKYEESIALLKNLFDMCDKLSFPTESELNKQRDNIREFLEVVNLIES